MSYLRRLARGLRAFAKHIRPQQVIHVQRVEIVVRSDDEPSRIARLVLDAIRERQNDPQPPQH